MGANARPLTSRRAVPPAIAIHHSPPLYINSRPRRRLQAPPAIFGVNLSGRRCCRSLAQRFTLAWPGPIQLAPPSESCNVGRIVPWNGLSPSCPPPRRCGAFAILASLGRRRGRWRRVVQPRPPPITTGGSSLSPHLQTAASRFSLLKKTERARHHRDGHGM